MINFVVGNLFESDAFALVNTVNCEGHMGKGIAYQFKLRYPEMNSEYEEICKANKLRPGILHSFSTGTKLIVNFPTKDKWRGKSKIEYVTSGLDALVDLIKEKKIPSIAIPPLGCGNGGLIWSEVKPLIIEKLSCFGDDVAVYVYEPSQSNQIDPAAAAEPQLTLSALLLMRIKFLLKDDNIHFTKTCLQNTAYFMNVLSNTECFHFVKDTYGPYDYDIDGISKKIKEFEHYHKVKNTDEAYNILLNKLISSRTTAKIEFYSPYIERAASFTNHFSNEEEVEGAGTALFIIQQKQCATADDIIDGFKQWSDDKAKRFSEASILSAIEELNNAGFIQETLCGYMIDNE